KDRVCMPSPYTVRSSPQRLHDEVRHDAPVIGMHSRPVGIENTRNFYPQLMLPPIIKEQGLRAALPFVIAGANSDRIDVAPVFLRLRMDLRIAVYFRCRSLKDFCAQSFREPEHIDGPMHARLCSLHRVELVINRRGRTGK